MAALKALVTALHPDQRWCAASWAAGLRRNRRDRGIGVGAGFGDGSADVAFNHLANGGKPLLRIALRVQSSHG